MRGLWDLIMESRADETVGWDSIPRKKFLDEIEMSKCPKCGSYYYRECKCDKKGDENARSESQTPIEKI